MYLSHYGLKVKPFQMSTDPKFLWLGDKHKEALAILKYGIFENKGVLAVTGDVGTGKTTLINALVKDLGKDIIVATIYDPGLEPLEFFNLVAVSLNMGATFKNKGEFLIHFRQFLQKAREVNRKVLLIIDEAQRIGPELLEEARLLSNLEAEHVRLLNIFFIGQNEFVDILQEDINRALRQRIAISYDIKPLTLEETAAYVNHRLRIAGAKTPIFTQGAVQEIFDFSNGFPRLINIVCDHALLSGFVKGVRSINDDIIRECKKELHVSEWVSRQDKDAGKESTLQEEKQNVQAEQYEEPNDEQDGVRLARGLYREAPVARADKMPVGLAILSVVLILLIAGVAGYVYYSPGKKAKLLGSISFKKDKPSNLKPTDSKANGKYLVPFIPESKEKASPQTNGGVETSSESEIKVAGQPPFEEVTSKDTLKPDGELTKRPAGESEMSTPDGKEAVVAVKQDIQSEKEKTSMSLASKEPAIAPASKKASDSTKKTIPEAKKPEIQSKTKEIKPQPDTSKDVPRSVAGSRKDEQAVKVVVPKESTSKKKTSGQDKTLTANVDRNGGIEAQQNKDVAADDERKVLEENLESRLKAFLDSYSRAYKNMRLDQLTTFFAPDAVEDGKPFTQQVPKYRRNFERIDALDYDIKMNTYSIKDETGLVDIEGNYFAKAQLVGDSGEWKQSQGKISMALSRYKDTFRIKRLSSMSQGTLRADSKPPLQQQDSDKKPAISSEDDLLARLTAFLSDYSKVYESMQLDKLATFFTADATEKGEPFRSQLPIYRRNFKMIDTMDYRIDLKRYSVQESSDLIRLEGVANLRTKLARDTGEWRESSIGIFMELAAYGDSFKIRRLDY